ncbi:Nucleic acid-binding, OB-fold [Sesbania bispinosa]|nr:Nucleic acid-binding, OB-fold [Sesbania bispinosa]
MTYFGVVDNGGSYRVTSHDFKLLFQARTKVIPTDSVTIPRFGLDLKNSEYVQNTKGECDYLIDVIGLVTAVGEEKHHEKWGRTISVLELELTDDKGVIKRSLFGHFIDIIYGFLRNGGDELCVLIIQFAKVKNFLGVVSINTMHNSTRLLWNPQIPEAISFKNGIAEHGYDMTLPLGVIGCEANVTDITSRYRFRIDVNNGQEKTHFVVFNSDCEILLVKSEGSFPDISDDGKSEDGKSVNGQINCVPLEDAFNDPLFSPVSLGESSNVVACLAPEKCKAVGRVGVTPLSKKRGKGNGVNLEK